MKRVACLLLAGSLALAASAHAAPANAPTFTKDVAPIVFNKCAACHRAGEVLSGLRPPGAPAQLAEDPGRPL